jgi:hypothetical protein
VAITTDVEEKVPYILLFCLGASLGPQDFRVDRHCELGWLVVKMVGIEGYILRVPEGSRKLEKDGKGKLNLGQAYSLFKRVIGALVLSQGQ